jgi:uncharacterized phage-associated protein
MFRAEEGTELAAHVLKWAGGRMDVIHLVKMIYWVDRESMHCHGHSISSDSFVSMPNGPVPTNIYDLINWRHAPNENTTWSIFIAERNGNEVGLKRDPERKYLSEAQLALARKVFDEKISLPMWELVDKTHELPEWEDPREKGGAMSLPIQQERLLAALGWSPEDIERLMLEDTEDQFWEDLEEATYG